MVHKFTLIFALLATACAAPQLDVSVVERGELLARSKYQDYEAATFSFEHGVRDDPGLALTRNDWDLQFGNGGDNFTVNMVTDDRSRLLDLGEMGWDQLRKSDIATPDPLAEGQPDEKLPVIENHIYLIRTVDRETDLTALARVERLTPGDRVEFTWKIIENRSKPTAVVRASGVTQTTQTTRSTPSTPETPRQPQSKQGSQIGLNGKDGGKESPYHTGLATLYCNDPLSRTWSFGDDEEGHVFQDFMVKNGGSDIDFGGYSEGGFTVAVEGGVRGMIVDLGTQDELQEKYGYSETTSGGQGFASIRREGNQFVILKNYKDQTTQTLTEAGPLFGELKEYCVSLPVVADHIYLMRLTDRHEPEFERIVKFKVVAFRPGESVTMRWVRLTDQ
jgi:hypothetical protein